MHQHSGLFGYFGDHETILIYLRLTISADGQPKWQGAFSNIAYYKFFSNNDVLQNITVVWPDVNQFIEVIFNELFDAM